MLEAGEAGARIVHRQPDPLSAPRDDPGRAFLAPRRVRIWYGMLAAGLVGLAGLVGVVGWLRRG